MVDNKDSTTTTSSKDDFDFKYKVVVLGDTNCGKSTLLDSKKFLNYNY